MRHPRLAVATALGLIALATGAIAAHTHEFRVPILGSAIPLIGAIAPHQSAPNSLSSAAIPQASDSGAEATRIAHELEVAQSTESTETATELPAVSLSADRTQLSLTYLGTTHTINASSLNLRVLDAVDCDRLELAPEQILTGQWFFPSIAIDQNTGNVALPALLRECAGTQVGAVFVIDPQPGAYAIYRVQVPGDRPLPDEFSTFPLSSITDVGYLGSDLLVKHGDASGSTALLVFAQQPTIPVGRYVGCVYTIEEEGRRLCPEDSAD
ncbi:MAG: hypothetical protein KME20_07880 [Kaiparowitsia implicata GSE-PSE-MK54-09C]|nr:hypothetical protein [Kaiparowitsia implicata GSE-PSE-MK54-09C]